MGLIRLMLALVMVPGAMLALGTRAEGKGQEDPPFVRLAFYDVYAAPGDTVSFDASLSLDPAGQPMSFEWDFTGDGAVDLVTADPFVTWVYDEPFDGTGLVRAVTPDGRSGTAELEVHIAAESELQAMFEPPGQPRSVEARRTSRDVAVLTWEAPSSGGTVAGYVARGADEGLPAGVAVGPDETTMEIVGVPESELVLTLEAVNERDRASDPVEVTLPAAPVGRGLGRWLWLGALAVVAGGAAAATWLVVRRFRSADAEP